MFIHIIITIITIRLFIFSIEMKSGIIHILKAPNVAVYNSAIMYVNSVVDQYKDITQEEYDQIMNQSKYCYY